MYKIESEYTYVKKLSGSDWCATFISNIAYVKCNTQAVICCPLVVTTFATNDYHICVQRNKTLTASNSFYSLLDQFLDCH